MNDSENIAGLLKQLTPAVLLQIALILAGAWLLVAAIEKALPWLAERIPGRRRPYVMAAVPTLRLVIIIVSIVLIVLKAIQPNFENIVALLTTLGIVLGFAFKDYLSSLIAGVVTLYEMPYVLGDWVEIDGVYGEVRAIRMRVVELLTPDDTVVVVPHIKLWNSLIHNGNDGSQKLQCVADFHLHPRHDAERVRQVLHEAALASPFLRIDAPVVVIVAEKPWGTHYRLKAYPVDPRQQFLFISDLTVRGKDVLTRMGVEFAAAVSAAPGAGGA
jgi:small conductance mechanosensitive channel